MRGNLLQDVVRGVERNRAWPSPRLSNRTRAQIDQSEWFRTVNWAFKFMAPDMQAAFIRATHRTSLYPRDLFSIMLSGGLAWIVGADGKRSEERRVGKECVSTCSARGSPDHKKKKKEKKTIKHKT